MGPFSMGAISIGSSVLGGIIGAFGAKGKAESDSSMYAYKAGLAKINAENAKQNAAYSRKAGESEALRSGQKTAFTVSSQKVAQSGRGVDVNSGSAAAVRDSTTALGQKDQTTIRENSARRAYGFEIEAVNKEAEATMDMKASENAITAGKYSVAESILGSASSVSSKWLQGNSAGLWGNT